MKKLSVTIPIFLFWVVFFGETSLSWGGDELTEEQTLACESILCLSSGDRPSECNPALNYFFGIKRDDPSDTKDARRNFLKKCPDSNADGMSSLINVLVDYNCSACTVEELNKNLIEARILVRIRRGKYIIKSVMIVDPEIPAYCQKYYAAISSNENTAYSQYSQLQPVYVGFNLGFRTKDDDGNEYYLIYANSRDEQAAIAETISENHWEWSE